MSERGERAKSVIVQRPLLAAAIVLAVVLGSSCGLFGDYDFGGYKPKTNNDTGMPVLQGTFVGGAVRGEASGIELTGEIVWHGAVKSHPNAEGIELEGWLR